MRFKPYYKWNTFNTYVRPHCIDFASKVLNLIISGIPSILHVGYSIFKMAIQSFKPYYKWNTFNTKMIVDPKDMDLLF